MARADRGERLLIEKVVRRMQLLGTVPTSSGHIIRDNSISFQDRASLTFTGTGIASITDDAANDRTIVDISGGGGGGTPFDASDTVKGIVFLSAAPASSINPIAVGDNDARLNPIIELQGTAFIGGDKTGAARGVGSLDIQASRILNTDVSSGDSSITLGNSCSATGLQGIAIGNLCRSTANLSGSIGLGLLTTAAGTIDIGFGTNIPSGFDAKLTIASTGLTSSIGGVISRIASNNIVTLAVTATLTNAQTIALVNSASPVTIGLPTVPLKDEFHKIKQIGTGQITVSGNGKLIDGAVSKILINQNDAFEFIFDGMNWFVF